MRASVGNTSGGNGASGLGVSGDVDPGQAPEVSRTGSGRGKRARVRSRLIVAVAVVAAAVVGAGAPVIVGASDRVSESQTLVDDAQQTQRSLALSHALADERDEVTRFIAAGRSKGQGLSEERGARVDRQVDELRVDAPAALRRTLDDVAAVRRSALTGKGSALEAHTAYSRSIGELHARAEDLAERIPVRAGSGAYALADLDRAVEQASAARGLLLAALAVPRTTTTEIDPATGLRKAVVGESSAARGQRDALSAAGQRARVREQAALEDFHDSGTTAAVTAYDSTVTGPDATRAEAYLKNLADAPTLSASELRYDEKSVDAALTARIDLMRGAEAALGDQRVKRLEQLRDDDVTALEIRIALVGVCLLAAVGVAMGTARSLTRPLAALRIGSARVAGDPAAEDPVKFTGRNDEFAQVVDSINALHAHAVGLHGRIGTLESDRKHLVGERQRMADDRDRLRGELADTARKLDRVKHSIHGTFVNLALRTLGLVERQLGIIEGLEEREQDPERLATLYKLDHSATVMRRHSENLLVLAGTERGPQHGGSVALVDMVRAAVSEIERYERVRIAALPPHAHLAGFAADDLSHLIAELLENATSFSPPDASVEVSGWLLESGSVMLSVQDEGIGMTDDRMRELNTRLSSFTAEEAHDPEDVDGFGLGLYVVARLAVRHGVRVRLREQKQGGVAAVAVLPASLFAAAPAASVPPAVLVPGAAPAVRFAGSEAEANSNELYGRTEPERVLPAYGDPLIEAAEQAVRESTDSLDSTDATDSVDSVEPPVEIPAETPAETTMALSTPVAPEPTPEAEPERAPEPESAPEPVAEVPHPRAPHDGHDEHDRPAGHPELLDQQLVPEPAPEPAPEPEPAERVTAKGLPKRTPKVAAPASAPKPRTGSVDAEALRRKLGGFHRGATAGRRDVTAEFAENPGRRSENEGDTAEEASS
ncbi:MULTISPECIES: nitrate- and nitrite sensing domain-containing protein [unclassified Streptomyces]|uniref:sensor histidine kinase n=1 Tax=unclassified Streptomyces TaxID=2593676 RepID=UPI002E18E5BF|nr:MULTISPECIES: nitrate- and nitrite sensing domain-containing protein [unclassified Streptomyces]